MMADAEVANALSSKPSAATGRALDDASVCENPKYSSVTLKVAIEMPMVGLFDTLHGYKKFEASDVIAIDQQYYVVYDNLFEIGRIDRQFGFHSPQHQLIAPSEAPAKGSSNYEGIVYVQETGTFYLMVEAAPHNSTDGHPNEKQDGKNGKELFHAWVDEIALPADNKLESGYTLKRRCRTEFAFTHSVRGFEGVTYVYSDDGELILLGMCEGNNCHGGKEGRDRGHGRVVLMRFRPASDHAECLWETIDVVHLPKSVYFTDYSALTVRRTRTHNHTYDVAITSQEDSQVWLGTLKIGSSKSAKGWEFNTGRVLNFPRNDLCEVVYCNVEGVSFLPNEDMLVVVSDKMKKDGSQPFRCLPKDQSIHTFILP